MSSVAIRIRPKFTLISTGNGLSYTLELRATGENVFVQGEDATRFKEELDALEEHRDTDEALAILWGQYAD